MNGTKGNPAYEATDAPVLQVVAGAAILIGSVLLSLGVAAWVYRGVAAHPSGNSPAMSFAHGSENAPSIVRDWREQDELVHDHLENYAWVDREKGVGRMPIDRAMELMAREAAEPAGGKP